MTGDKELGESIVGKFIVISLLLTLLGRYILFKISLNPFGKEMGDDRKTDRQISMPVDSYAVGAKKRQAGNTA